MNGEYLAKMEDVLRVYEQKAQAQVVRLCFDERPCQLLEEVFAPLPLQAGKPLRQDYEYERQGTACVLLAYDLDTGQRYVQVRKTRTKQDYAQFMQWLVNTHYPQATRLQVVQDNLNTHQMSSFYEHLPVAEAGTLATKIRFHYTPKHGSWLNMAEIEFSALTKQCLDRRIKDLQTLETQVLAWSQQRNEKKIKIHWSFTVDTARVTLASKYEKVNPNNTSTSNN